MIKKTQIFYTQDPIQNTQICRKLFRENNAACYVKGTLFTGGVLKNELLYNCTKQ